MTVMTPEMTAAEPVRHGVLRVTFSDGLSGDVDVLPFLWGPVFDTARTPEGFAQGRFDPHTGTVVWPGGADFAPDTLYVRVSAGQWPDDLARSPDGR